MLAPSPCGRETVRPRVWGSQPPAATCPSRALATWPCVPARPGSVGAILPPPPRARGPSGCGRRLFPRWVCLPLPQVGAWETKFYKFCCLPHKLTYVIIHHRVNYNVSDPN